MYISEQQLRQSYESDGMSESQAEAQLDMFEANMSEDDNDDEPEAYEL